MTRFSHPGVDKRRFVRHLFREVAPRYDFVNRLLTLGMDARWRRNLAVLLGVEPGERVLDLACGTGEVALQIGRLQPRCRLVGADPVPEMLSRAAGRLPSLAAVCCEAESLPFRSESFQAVTIAFGLRNFSFLEQGLEEVRRVMVPGGRLGILEFAPSERGWLKGFYRWYLYRVVPHIGALFSRGYAYQYLLESIQHFSTPAGLISMLNSIGFAKVHTRRFLGGTVWLYFARK